MAVSSFANSSSECQKAPAAGNCGKNRKISKNTGFKRDFSDFQAILGCFRLFLTIFSLFRPCLRRLAYVCGFFCLFCNCQRIPGRGRPGSKQPENLFLEPPTPSSEEWNGHHILKIALTHLPPLAGARASCPPGLLVDGCPLLVADLRPRTSDFCPPTSDL